MFQMLPDSIDDHSHAMDDSGYIYSINTPEQSYIQQWNPHCLHTNTMHTKIAIWN
jgi:hypothetical protein